MGTAPCPDCTPRSSSGGFAKKLSGCAIVVIDCRRCKGAGRISIEEAARIRVGGWITEWRQERDLSCREAAKALSMGVVELSDAEHGRIDAAPTWKRIRSFERLSFEPSESTMMDEGGPRTGE